MDPPAEKKGTLRAKQKTTDEFDDQTCHKFGDQTTGNFDDKTTNNFDDKTSITPPLLPRAKIVMWGDSLTQTSFEGWGSQLANRYQRRADIVNRGMSGYNSTWWLQLPEESFENVLLCTIWFGANDASLKDLNPHHYVSIDDYKANLKKLVEKAKKLCQPPPSQKQTNILLITPPPVDHEQRFAFQKQRYGDKATGQLERTLENSGKYAAACQQVATELKVPCLNLWEQFQQAQDNWSEFLWDGLHFSPKGHDFVFKCLAETIAKVFPSLVVMPDPFTGQACNSGSVSKIPAFGPYHDQIDASQPDVAMKEAFQSMALQDQAQHGHHHESAASPGATPDPKKPKLKMDAP